MDELDCVIVAVWRCMDACCLLFDLILCTISWLLCSLWAACTYLHGALVGLSSSGVAEYGNVALFSFLTATEAVSSGIHGVLYTLDSWLQTMGGVFESFKMVGHLFCHMAWRTKELLHRTVISGTSILRQTCEGVCIVLSLAVYFVNTVVNILLISTQNFLSVLATICETVATPLHKAVELVLTLLTFLYSCLLGISVLLWTPCQLILDITVTSLQVFVTFLTANIYTFIMSAVVLCCLGYVLLNTRVQFGQLRFFLVNILNCVQVTAQRVLALIQEQAFQMLHRDRREMGVNETQNIDQSIPDASRSNESSETNQLTQETPTTPDDNGSNNSVSSLSGRSGALTDTELLQMLKDQEERKKCVICQDFSKTVLLLPCRHLCLCSHCADILTQRGPIQQRCCPLCRQPITQTMEVFL